MVPEIMTSMGLLKSIFDITKGLKDVSDATIRNAAIIEIQEKVIAAQQAQQTLIQHVSDLEKEVTQHPDAAQAITLILDKDKLKQIQNQYYFHHNKEEMPFLFLILLLF